MLGDGVARSIAVRWWLAGGCLAGSVALIGAVPAIAGAAQQPVTVSARSVTLTLPGALAPDGPPAGGYPDGTDPSWPLATTPAARFTATVDGQDVDVVCLDPCRPDVPADYAVDPADARNPAVTGILAAANQNPTTLDADGEAAAVQAAVWYVSLGFVVDAEVDPAIRARVAALVAAPADSGEPAGPLVAGALLIGAEPDAPRLLLARDLPGAGQDPADQPGAAAPLLAAADESTATDTSSTATSVTPASTSTVTSTVTSTDTGTPTSNPATSGTVSSGSGTTSTADGTFYADCTAVWAALGRPLLAGEPGYARHLDRDGDGTACEEDPNGTGRATTSPAITDPATTSAPAAAGGGSDDTLASTGFDVVRPLATGGALMLGGGSLVILGRPRRARSMRRLPSARGAGRSEVRG